MSLPWLRTDKPVLAKTPESPQCDVPLVSLPRLRTGEPSLSLLNSQKAPTQCSTGVIAMASHRQACSAKTPESPNAMFNWCRRYGFAQTVQLKRQRAQMQCSTGVIAMASHRQARSCENARKPQCNVPLVSLPWLHNNTACHRQCFHDSRVRRSNSVIATSLVVTTCVFAFWTGIEWRSTCRGALLFTQQQRQPWNTSDRRQQ